MRDHTKLPSYRIVQAKKAAEEAARAAMKYRFLNAPPGLPDHIRDFNVGNASPEITEADCRKAKPVTTSTQSADAEGWIKWAGGELCPVPIGSKVEARWSDGAILVSRATLRALGWMRRDGDGPRIVEYRICV